MISFHLLFYKTPTETPSVSPQPPLGFTAPGRLIPRRSITVPPPPPPVSGHSRHHLALPNLPTSLPCPGAPLTPPPSLFCAVEAPLPRSSPEDAAATPTPRATAHPRRRRGHLLLSHDAPHPSIIFPKPEPSPERRLPQLRHHHHAISGEQKTRRYCFYLLRNGICHEPLSGQRASRDEHARILAREVASSIPASRAHFSFYFARLTCGPHRSASRIVSARAAASQHRRPTGQ